MVRAHARVEAGTLLQIPVDIEISPARPDRLISHHECDENGNKTQFPYLSRDRSPAHEGQLTCGKLSCGLLTCGELTCGKLTCGELTCGKLTCGELTCGGFPEFKHRKLAVDKSIHWHQSETTNVHVRSGEGMWHCETIVSLAVMIVLAIA